MTGNEPRTGDWLGRYQLVEVLGRGGMGTVFRARDPQLERDVAVKVINPALAEDAEFRERFRREAVVLSRMDSAHVVAVHDHGEQDGAPYLVTQLVRGGDLFSLIRTRGVLEPAYAIDMTTQVLEGLADAHAVGVVHRDVKPSNVLLREDGRTAYLCDFGIASSPGQELTRTGALVGSSGYMAPERHAGETAASSGVAADVYATGCLLWHVLTGSQPYVGTEAEVAMGHLHGPVPQLPGTDEFTDRLNAVMRRAMAKDPQQRYPSARAMLTDLTALKALVPGGLVLPEVTSIRQSVVPPPARQVRRRVLAVAMVTALVGGAVYVGSLVGGADMVPAVLGTGSPSTSAAGESTTGEPRDWSSGTTSAAPRSKAPRREVPTGEGVAAEERAPQTGAARKETDAKPRVKPRKPRTTAPAPAPGTTAPAPTPVAKFQCWNGSRVATYSSCTWPAGSTGSAWVFPRRQAVGGCKRMGALSGRVVGWACPVRYGDGTTGQISFQQWRTVNAAETYFWNRYVPSRARQRGPWVINQTYFGRAASGWLNRRGGPAHAIRIYGAKGTRPWVLAVQAPTTQKRATAFSRVGFRWPNRFRGVPIS